MGVYKVQDRYGEMFAYVESEVPITPEDAWGMISRYWQHRNERGAAQRDARQRAERAGVLPIVPPEEPNEGYRAYMARIGPVQEARQEWQNGVGAQFRPMKFEEYIRANKPEWRLLEIIKVIGQEPDRQAADPMMPEREEALLPEDDFDE